MAPQFVKPYVKTHKADAADAEAICEAVSRPNLRFVPIKTPEQQEVLALHRMPRKPSSSGSAINWRELGFLVWAFAEGEGRGEFQPSDAR